MLIVFMKKCLSCCVLLSGCHGVVLLDRMVVLELHHDIYPLSQNEAGISKCLSRQTVGILVILSWSVVMHKSSINIFKMWYFFKGVGGGGGGGAVAHGVSSFSKKFDFASLCSFICLQAVYQLSLQAVYQLSGAVCKATWNGYPSYSASHLHFTLCD